MCLHSREVHDIFCPAVSTQVSHTISQVHVPHRTDITSEQQSQIMKTQGKQLSPADAKADTQGLPSLFCGCRCSSTAHRRILPLKPDTVRMWMRIRVWEFMLEIQREFCVRLWFKSETGCCAIFRGTVTFLLSSGHPWRSLVTHMWQKCWPPRSI